MRCVCRGFCLVEKMAKIPERHVQILCRAMGAAVLPNYRSQVLFSSSIFLVSGIL